jgi:predicted membrane-bound spermidine synthase
LCPILKYYDIKYHNFFVGVSCMFYLVFIYLCCCLSLVDQKLSTLPGHLINGPIPLLVLMTNRRFVMQCFSLLFSTFSLGYCIVCPLTYTICLRFGIFRLFSSYVCINIQINTSIDCFQIYHNNKQVLYNFINVLLIVDVKY